MKNIIIGYPCIGKTSCSKANTKFIDLESSNFIIDGAKSPDWYKIYCNIAIDLASNHNVFISSHTDVRNYMKTMPENIRYSVIVIYPALSLKDEWIKKMKDRYEKTNLDKDKRAYEYISNHYDETVTDIMRDTTFGKIELKDANFIALSELINNYNMSKSASYAISNIIN